jgi:hypothetical protein
MKHSTTTKTALVAAALFSAAACGEPCHDNPETPEVACDADLCLPAAGETGDTEGGEEYLCTPYYEPEFVGQTMACNDQVSTGEHCVQDAANNYGITDYAFETGQYTLALKFDFQPIPDVIVDDEPIDWFAWEDNWLTAVPGVVTHEENGLTYAAYMSRGCCAQWAVGAGPRPDKMFPSETCRSGYTLNETPDAWCLDMLDGTHAGLCVYPCDEDNDCPNPAGEFCDLSRPDPGGHAPGVCRYNSMPLIPTPLTEIGDHQPPAP